MSLSYEYSAPKSFLAVWINAVLTRSFTSAGSRPFSFAIDSIISVTFSIVFLFTSLNFGILILRCPIILNLALQFV